MRNINLGVCGFMDDNIFIRDNLAERLYDYARGLKIYDYHCHLDPKDICSNKVFYNLTELWLRNDHYKWRIMRNAGVEERFITGNEDDYQKFYAFACALENFIGNQVYQWAQLELKQYFGLTLPICEKNAREIWDKTCKVMNNGLFNVNYLLKVANVEAIFTTDDPLDELKFHKILRDGAIKICPTFRVDKLFNINSLDWKEYIFKLEKLTMMNICDFESFIAAVGIRFNYFLSNGCRSMDCSMTDIPAEGDANLYVRAFSKALKGETLSCAEHDAFQFKLLTELLLMCEENGAVMQLHTGVIRNQNKKLLKKLSVDCGNDSVGAPITVYNLSALFNAVSCKGELPKTIIYTLNRCSYYEIATLLASFAGGYRGKLQLGAAWWFMDSYDGIREQLGVYSNILGLGLFNGMLTDSRSFTSYSRHDYFRRILCSFVSGMVNRGEYPSDIDLLKNLIEGVCFKNAEKYFSIQKNN